MLLKSSIVTKAIINLDYVMSIQICTGDEPGDYEVSVYLANQHQEYLALFSGTLQECEAYQTWLETELRKANLLLPSFVPPTDPASVPSEPPEDNE